MKKYKHTLNLPNTSLPIKLKPQREEELLKLWNDEDIYNTSYQNGEKKFILHSGPPYANGFIHHGHILNVVLKDIVCKFHTLTGYKVDFKMGFDCHGIPIAAAVEKKLGNKKQKMSKVEFRQECRNHAEKYSKIQLEQFERLGIIHDKEPYSTMSPKYEAQTLRELAKFVESDLLYRGLKPVFWCPTHRTALANSDIEYNDNHISKSVYVLLKLENKDNEYIIVWTTTPWTLLGNEAVAVGKNILYTPFKINNKKVWLADSLAENLLDSFDIKLKQLERSSPGSALTREKYYHPLKMSKVCPIVTSDHVNTESGTGFVHIAPGHGEDDFLLGKKYNLEIKSVIEDNGKSVYGLNINDTTDRVISKLGDKLLRIKSFTHSYPYSSRSNKPIITKTTEQWFINIDKPYNNGPTLRDRALAALDKVKWIPEHGYNRIKKMLETRPDWCLSRQRAWGVPIPNWKCNKCNYNSLDLDYINMIAANAELGKLDSWFIDENCKDAVCPNCEKAGGYFAGHDILDVWFDSGVSNAAVMGGKQVDLYLEGSDQHRGWFQSTLLAALGARELIPYKAVLTHGFVVDNKGEKLAKSKGNYIDPFKFIKQYGVESLRLWVASSEFKNDIRFSEEILNGVKQTAHKIRNTARYMIAATNDFDITRKDYSPLLTPLDRYILDKWNDVFCKCLDAYKNYEFHTVVKNIENFCILELSSFYFEAIKDRLYCSGYDWETRRAAQYVLYLMVRDMIQLMSPIMSFTMDDAWRHLTKDSCGSVFLSTIKEEIKSEKNDNFQLIDEVRELKKLAYIDLEKLRNAGKIGSFIEANVIFTLTDELIKYNHLALSDILCVSNVYVEYGEEARIRVEKAKQKQCQRCWKHSVCVADDICSRCLLVLNG